MNTENNVGKRLEAVQEIVEFDETDYFESEIAEKLRELKVLLNRARIPFFFTACVKNDEKESVYKSTMIGKARFPLLLFDDKITKCLSVMAGFKTVFPNKDITMDIDQVLEAEKEKIQSGNSDGFCYTECYNAKNQVYPHTEMDTKKKPYFAD